MCRRSALWGGFLILTGYVVGTLADLPDLVGRIEGGPAVLVIGDVVAHSAPWRQYQLNQVICNLLEAAE